MGHTTLVPLGTSSRVEANLDHANSILAAYSNPPDYWEWQVWNRVLKPGDLFVDVGANVGLYSLLAAEVGCRVLAFEPDESNRAALERNIGINSRQGTITVLPEAVSDHVGHVSFRAGEDALARIAADEDAGAVRIPCTTLDAVIGQELVAGLKIDVEGAEFRVLKGAERLLRSRAIGLIQMECNQMSEENFGESRDESVAFLSSCGYVPSRFSLQHEDWGPEGQANIFFERA